MSSEVNCLILVGTSGIEFGLSHPDLYILKAYNRIVRFFARERHQLVSNRTAVVAILGTLLGYRSSLKGFLFDVFDRHGYCSQAFVNSKFGVAVAHTLTTNTYSFTQSQRGVIVWSYHYTVNEYPKRTSGIQNRWRKGVAIRRSVNKICVLQAT